jgi:hypothetical protein
MTQSLTPEQFLFWLKGYIDANDNSYTDQIPKKPIEEKLKQVNVLPLQWTLKYPHAPGNTPGILGQPYQLPYTWCTTEVTLDGSGSAL